MRNITGGYGGRAILDGLDLVVRAREIVCVIGHNGAGKSTLLKAVYNMLPAVQGEILFDGRSILGRPPHRLLSQGIAYVPQNHTVFPRLTVAENLRMGGWRVSDKGLLPGRLERVEALFPMLAARRRQLAGSLSGGEQRMLEIARTLMVDPSLIMLDEPSIGLAPKMIDTVFETVRLLRDQGKAILMVEQNVRKALASSDRAYILELGRIKLEDEARALLDDGRIAELYMGG